MGRGTSTIPPAKDGTNPALGRLKNLGVEALYQAAFLLPKSYQDLRCVRSDFRPLRPGDIACIAGQVPAPPSVRFDQGQPRTMFSLCDSSGSEIRVTLFGDPRWGAGQLQRARSCPVCLYGKVEEWAGRLCMTNPLFVVPPWVGRVMPVYSGKAGVIRPETVCERVQALLPAAIPAASAWLRTQLRLPSEQAERHLLLAMGALTPTFTRLLTAIHLPPTPDTGEAAQHVLARLDALAALSQSAPGNPPENTQAPALPVGRADLAALTQRLPFVLTCDQRIAVAEIAADLASGQPMRRLLSGDVGTGKTAVYGCACALVVRAGERAVVLVPHQLLAAQIVECFRRWWPDLGAGLVTAETDGIPATRLLVGTTALLHRLAAHCRPALVVVDEQHRFSRAQREALAIHGAHLLEATATCIPRTLALLQYGGMAVSKLTHCHVEKRIETRIVEADGRSALFTDIKRTIHEGTGQVLVIYPLAEQEAEADRRSAEGAFALWQRHFPDRVRFVHGRLTEDEKDAAVEALRRGAADILVSTTVVEVGIDLPALRHIVVVHAERFGLTTLHQLRGRVARTGGFGRCDLLLPQPISEKSRRRLLVLTGTTDGFEVARQDMLARGFGDLAGDSLRQTGKEAGFLVGHGIDMETVESVVEEGILDKLLQLQGAAPAKPDPGPYVRRPGTP